MPIPRSSLAAVAATILLALLASLPLATAAPSPARVAAKSAIGTSSIVSPVGRGPSVPDADAAAIRASAPLTAAEALTLTILHTNDVHAHVDEWVTNGITYGGAARMASEIRRVRATEDNVILLDAGDQFQGTMFYRVFQSDVLTVTMNALGYDAMVVGNHEFDDGSGELARFAAGVMFPILGANVSVLDVPESLLHGWIAPTTVITASGQPVGIVGLTTPDSMEISSPGWDVEFLDPIETALDAVADLEARGIDRIVALSHLGYGDDLALARAVPALDVIVGGHTHTFLGLPADAAVGPYPTVVSGADGARTLVVSAGEWGRVLGRLDVAFDADGRVAAYAGGPILLDGSVAKDPAVEAIVSTFRAPLEACRARIVGESEVELPIRVGSDLVCRIGECALGDLVADAMLSTVTPGAPYNHDLVIVNGGSLRAPLPAGPISVADVMEVLPFGNTMATFALTGTYVLQALENGVGAYPEQAGRFPQVAGLRFQWDPGRAVGSRIVRAEVFDADLGAFRPLDPARVYHVATNDYLRRGGDGYTVFRDRAVDPYDFGAPLDQVLMDDIESFSPIAPETDGRIERFRWTALLPLALDLGAPYVPPPMSDEDYRILRSVIEYAFLDGPGSPVQRLVIENATSTSMFADQPGLPDFLSSNLPDLERATFDAYVARNRAAAVVEDRFGVRVPVVLPSRDEIDAIFGGGGDGWARFYERYPGAQGIMTVSRPGIAPDGMQALVYVGNQSHYLAGAGVVYLLALRDGAWVVVDDVMIWIS